MPCLYDEPILSKVVPGTPNETLPRCSQQTFERQSGALQATLSPEASLESTQNVRLRYSYIKINDVRFAILIFQLFGAIVPLSVQKSPSLSHYVCQKAASQPKVDLGI